jgi:branched-chain amino acid transport system substrate-binding protein
MTSGVNSDKKMKGKPKTCLIGESDVMTKLRRRTVLGLAAGTIAAAYAPIIRAQQRNTIKIGISAPLSGALEPVGRPTRIGAEIARDEINAAGGVLGKEIELVILDDRGDSAQAVANMHEFASDHVSQVVGTPMTSTALASTAVIKDLDITLATTGTPDERFTHELYNPNYFNGAENTFTRCNAMADAMTQRFPDVTKWAAVLEDVTMGHDYWARAKKSFIRFYKEKLNKDLTFYDEIYIKLSGTDFKNELSKLSSSEAEGLFIVLPGSVGITFYQQSLQFQLAKKFKVMSDQALDIDVAKALKQNTPSNLWVSSYWYPDAFKQFPESVSLSKAIIAKTGDVPHGFSSLGHINVHAYAKAISAVGGTETAKVVAALEGMPLNTCKGPGFFRKEDHQFIAGTCLFSVKAKDGPPGFETADFVELDVAKENLANPPTPGVPIKI